MKPGLLAVTTLLASGSLAAPAVAGVAAPPPPPPPPPPIECDEGSICFGGEDPGDSSGGSDEEGGAGSGGDGSGGSGDGSGTTRYRWYQAVVIGVPPDECWTITSSLEDAPPPATRTYQYALDTLSNFGTNGVLWDVCPATAWDLVEDDVRAYWDSAPIPEPVGDVEPGYMITGMTAYLTIEDTPRITPGHPHGVWPPPPVSTVLGDLQLDVTLDRYEVDWGDGSPVETHDSPGVAYPGGEGQITHVYTDAGEVTITTVAYWSATMVLSGQPYPLGTHASLPSQHVLPIQQVQSVGR